MRCQHCGLMNGEDDHRCLHCGRRMPGIVVAAPAAYIGNTALAVSEAPAVERNPSPAPEQAPLFHPAQSQPPQQAPQAGFAVPKVIPFEAIQRQAGSRTAAAAAPAFAPVEETVKKPAAPRTAKKAQPTGQGNLDFRTNGAHNERVLATGVPAQLSGDGRVAPPMRRLTAGAMDAAMVAIGFGIFVGSAFIALNGLSGSSFGSGKALWIMMAISFALISLLYGLVWAIAGRETAGMNGAQLHLVTFDGAPLDARNRAVRFVAAWLSYCSGGLGLLWALADEENLAFHDHISKTYPAELPPSTVMVRQRR
ncbi:MAG TPA: RDD family protein [Bryobacteraceae bacterium]|nr:RDD family protein [Bryobacteraceae bacterium]